MRVCWRRSSATSAARPGACRRIGCRGRSAASIAGTTAAAPRNHAADRDGAFRLSADGTIAWSGGVVGRLLPGDSVLAPRVEPLPGEFLDGELREMVRRRLAAFLRDEISRRLAPLFRARESSLSGAGRGLVYQLAEALGSLQAAAVAAQRAALDAVDRKALARLGIRLGTEFVYLDRLLKPDAVALRGLLWSLWHGASLPAPVPEPGSLALPRDPSVTAEFYGALGYAVLGDRVLRVDRVERLAAAARRLTRPGGVPPPPQLAAIAARALADLVAFLPALGYRAIVKERGITFVTQKP